MTHMYLSRLHFPVTTLGPGRRLGIWFQGCSIRCPGCISADTWKVGAGQVDIESVASAVTSWLEVADGVTISGGEPFDQPEALGLLLTLLRKTFDGDVLVYSGHPMEALGRHLDAMPGLIDALITDPYDEASDQTRSLRGSDNQRLHFLTDLGKRRFGPYADRPFQRSFDLMLDPSGEVWMAGIPGREDFARLSASPGLFQTIKTTQDASSLKQTSQP